MIEVIIISRQAVIESKIVLEKYLMFTTKVENMNQYSI